MSKNVLPARESMPSMACRNDLACAMRSSSNTLRKRNQFAPNSKRFSTGVSAGALFIDLALFALDTAPLSILRDGRLARGVAYHQKRKCAQLRELGAPAMQPCRGTIPVRSPTGGQVQRSPRSGIICTPRDSEFADVTRRRMLN